MLAYAHRMIRVCSTF